MNGTAGDRQVAILEHGPQENHLVQFYEDDGALIEAVAKFVGAGLSGGDRILSIASADHQHALCERLQSDGFDVRRAQSSGQLVLLDARDTLARFMVDDVIDPNRFATVVGGLLARLAEGRPNARVRAYGEMVDVLCRNGLGAEALRLEQLWNDLAKRHSFSLLCAYLMDSFGCREQSELFDHLCGAHARVLPASGVEALEGSGDRLRGIARLQQRARSLEVEIRRRNESDAFRMLVENVKEYAIFMLDEHGIVATWNAGAERLKGYRADEIIGQHFSRFYPREDVDAGKCAYELEVASAEGKFEDEGWRCRKDGSRFWANVVITALRNQQGTLVGFGKVTRDLTERRRAEDERLKLAQAQEASRVTHEFLATVSHELRTPLNAILGWSTLVSSRTADPFVTKAIATIRRNALVQARLVEDLLDASRIVTGQLRIEVKSADFAAIVIDAVECVRSGAEARSITIHIERLDEPVLLAGDATRLQQIVWNLLSNAVKFTEVGGAIYVALENCGADVRLSIRDTGRGIDPGFLPYVFERFRQAESSTARRTGGLGLGLAIVRQLVELHGGTVAASSPGEGGGSTFTVQLPVRTVPVSASSVTAFDVAPMAQTPAGTRKTSLEGVRVLVVDDEPDARDLVSAMLEDHGALVALCASAPDAREGLAAFHPHVIVSDMGMPVEDGYQLVRTIRALPRDEGGATPIVALTAYAGPEHRRRGNEAGCDRYIVKPVDAEILASLVRSLATQANR
jgi:PAS domain S-box-containing protein